MPAPQDKACFANPQLAETSMEIDQHDSSKYFICKDEDLLRVFSDQYLLRPDQRTNPKSRPKPVPTRKIFRQEYPDFNTQFLYLFCKQNEDIWYEARSGSLGASDQASICGLDQHYKDNVFNWRVNTGRIAAEHLTTSDQYLPMDRGHAWEDEAGDIYGALYNSQVKPIGLLLHYQFPYVHVSQDILIVPGTDLLHNDYVPPALNTPGVSKNLIGEIKNPIQTCMKTKRLQQNTIPIDYIPQLLSQTDAFGADSVLFISNYKVNEWTNTNENCKAISIEGCPNKYLVGEMRVTRFFRNDKAVKTLYECVNEYRDHCINNPSVVHNLIHLKQHTLPSSWKQELSKTFICPPLLTPHPKRKMEIYIEQYNHVGILLSRGQAISATNKDFLITDTQYITLSEKRIQKLMDQLQTIVSKYYLPSSTKTLTTVEQIPLVFKLCIDFPPLLVKNLELDTEFVILPEKEVFFYTTTRDKNEAPLNPITGKIQGERSVHVNHLFHQKPLVKSLKQLIDKSDDCVRELDAPYVVLPTQINIKNPLFLDWLSKRDANQMNDTTSPGSAQTHCDLHECVFDLISTRGVL